MKQSRAIGILVGALAAVGTCGLAGVPGTRTALAQVSALVRDFYGEANEEVTAVDPVPLGMVCGSLSVDAGLTVQTTEPAGGFTGACLMNHAYGGGLPSVCYSPANAIYDQKGTVQCSAPTANVRQPDWYIHVDQDAGGVTRQSLNLSYRVLETCEPHMAQDCEFWSNGNCPCDTRPISHSCCTQFGAGMTTTDGRTATGTAFFH